VGCSLKIFADLHNHTRYSDGRDSPADIVRAAAERGLGAVAITDHDCVDGVEEALAAGAKLGVDVVPGVEVSSYIGPVEVHVLGYFVDVRDGGFLRVLGEYREERVARLGKMLGKLASMGIDIELGEVMAVAGSGSVGRPHLARALVEAGHASSVRDAFGRFVGDGGPAYVPRERISPREAVRIIKGSGGIPVLAHPGGMGNDGIIPALVADGIEGIEVYYSTHKPSAVRRYLGVARESGLVVTGGSDYHGSMKGEKVSVGAFGIDRDLYEKLLEYRER